MAVPTKISLIAIADEVVDVRLLTLELLEGSAAVSDIQLLHVVVSINAFALCTLRGCIVHCIAILRPVVQQHHLILAGTTYTPHYK
jgi:hypothetical protein